MKQYIQVAEYPFKIRKVHIIFRYCERVQRGEGNQERKI
jgi:hypothetical protein